MMSRAEQLATKRRALQLRCAIERREIASHTHSIEEKLGSVDRWLNVAHAVVRNPLIVAAGAVGLLLLKPWRLLKYAGQGWLVLSIIKRLMNRT